MNDDHGFMLNIAKWNGRIGHLQGAPLTSEDGSTELDLISRAGLFRLWAFNAGKGWRQRK
ncbi:hypothetical protein [Arthrobacter sp. OAP107]|uniref:hypothetical protein n=1 Tax=Arthrobacter sp. OAP107 TaxID=3156445 RepID=UPI00339444AF